MKDLSRHDIRYKTYICGRAKISEMSKKRQSRLDGIRNCVDMTHKYSFERK